MMPLAILLPIPALPPVMAPASVYMPHPEAPASAAVPFGFARNSTIQPLWLSVVQQLPAKDPETEFYTLAEIAPLLKIQPRSLARHCRDLWPKWEGHYRLNFSQATALIRRVCMTGRNVNAGAKENA